MDDYTRRRRRIDPEEPQGGGGLPIFPLVLAVIFAGLLLGGLLAHFMGNRSPLPAGASPAPSITPIATQEPTPTLAPTATPHASPHPSPSATVSPAASATPKRTPEPKPSVASTAAPTTRPSVIFITPAPAPSTGKAAAAKPAESAATKEPAPAETAAPVAPGGDRATAVVHSYLSALARGDESSAASYLMNGLPNEKFMTAGSKITSIDSVKNSDGTYKVTADIQTPAGEYFETFTVENGPAGMQISDHYAIKP